MKYRANVTIPGRYKVGRLRLALKPGAIIELEGQVDHPMLEPISEMEAQVDDNPAPLEDPEDEEAL